MKHKLVIAAVTAAMVLAGCQSPESPVLLGAGSPVGTLAFTKDLPKFPDTVQGVPANALSADSSRTYQVQTNALGYAVVNVPWTGGQAASYSVVTNSATLKCVQGTNVVPIPNGGTLAADTVGWEEGQSVFTKVVPAGSYSVSPSVKLAGYGIWPLTSFDCVVWKSGALTYVTVLREDE